MSGYRRALSLMLLMAGTAAADSSSVQDANELLWKGELNAAERAYEEVLSRDPANIDARLGLARARRWSGRPLAAREALAPAFEADPARADVRQELAWAYAAEGRASSADDVLGETRTQVEPGLQSELERLRRTSVSLSTVASQDSQGVTRIAPRTNVTLQLPKDLQLEVGLGSSFLRTATERMNNYVGGALLRWPIGRVRTELGVAGHLAGTSRLTEGQLGLVATLMDGMRIGLSVRRRPFLEPAEVLATDERAFHAAGTGGALTLAPMGQRGVDVAGVTFQSALGRIGYFYADGRGFRITDGNKGWSVASGLGIGVVRPFAPKSPFELTLRWDSYLTGFERANADYFSPPFLDGHSPGAEARLSLWGSTDISVEGGPTFPLASAAPVGYFAGAGIRVKSGRVSFGLRAQQREDPWFGSRRIWGSFGVEL